MYYNINISGKMATSVCVRLPDEIVSKMDALAKELDLSKTYIVKEALEEYLQEYADYFIAMERLKDKNDKIVSSKEMREQLGL